MSYIGCMVILSKNLIWINEKKILGTKQRVRLIDLFLHRVILKLLEAISSLIYTFEPSEYVNLRLIQPTLRSSAS